jgi:hypothetical protein
LGTRALAVAETLAHGEPISIELAASIALPAFDRGVAEAIASAAVRAAPTSCELRATRLIALLELVLPHAQAAVDDVECAVAEQQSNPQ